MVVPPSTTCTETGMFRMASRLARSPAALAIHRIRRHRLQTFDQSCTVPAAMRRTAANGCILVSDACAKVMLRRERLFDPHRVESGRLAEFAAEQSSRPQLSVTLLLAPAGSARTWPVLEPGDGAEAHRRQVDHGLQTACVARLTSASSVPTSPDRAGPRRLAARRPADPGIRQQAACGIRTSSSAGAPSRCSPGWRPAPGAGLAQEAGSGLAGSARAEVGRQNARRSPPSGLRDLARRSPRRSGSRSADRAVALGNLRHRPRRRRTTPPPRPTRSAWSKCSPTGVFQAGA